MDASSLEVFKAGLVGFGQPGLVGGVLPMAEGWRWVIFNPNYSVILSLFLFFFLFFNGSFCLKVFSSISDYMIVVI